MAKLELDRRTLEAEDAPLLRAKARELIARTREVELALSKLLAEIDEKRAYVFDGCGSIGEWAREQGYEGIRAIELATLGRALRAKPELATKVASGEVTTPAAATVAQLLVEPSLIKPDEDVIDQAAKTPLATLQRDVKKRIAAKRLGTDPSDLSPITFQTEPKTREAFYRARDLASQQAKRGLSYDETFKRLVFDWLDGNDPDRTKPRARRVGPTEERPQDRYIPRETVRAIAKRSNLRCEVPGCRHVAVEKAHVKPHEKGSGREARDLWDACHRHHFLYDKGILRICGWDAAGKPIFVLRDGRPKRGRPGGSADPP